MRSGSTTHGTDGFNPLPHPLRAAPSDASSATCTCFTTLVLSNSMPTHAHACAQDRLHWKSGRLHASQDRLARYCSSMLLEASEQAGKYGQRASDHTIVPRLRPERTLRTMCAMCTSWLTLEVGLVRGPGLLWRSGGDMMARQTSGFTAPSCHAGRWL
jgi:hypothetical protein